MHEIEGAVEIWKQQALPEIEANLLSQAQSQFTQEIKKTVKLAVTVHNRYGLRQCNGKFVFPLQKYQMQGQSTSYFQMTNQLQEGFISPGLQELCGYYSNRLSYEEVAGLVKRIAGEKLLSDQKIGQIVSAKALKISQESYKIIEATKR